MGLPHVRSAVMREVPGAGDDRPGRRSRLRWVWIAVTGVVGVLVVAAVVVVVGLFGFHAGRREVPRFPSLAERPDPSIRGTVAYYANDSGCIRIVPAGGGASREVWCLPHEGPSTWVDVGKPVGPQLVWLPDGRLEVTVFRMKATKETKAAPPLTRGWQKIVDVATGAVEDVPDAEAPSSPNLSTRPAVNGRGERLRTRFDPANGRAEVTLTAPSGATRTLLSVRGPGEYTYGFEPVFWSPDGDWIAGADDGRILVITPTDPAVTRVLATGTGGGAGGGTAGPTFAVTGRDFPNP